MYITITPQKMGGNFSKSSADFVGSLARKTKDWNNTKWNIFSINMAMRFPLKK